MGLGARGIISVVEIVIYIPILIVGTILSLRHGFTRKAGWILLVILSIIRIIGGVAHILSEQDPTNITDRVLYTIMESSGISPLLMATLGFLGTVSQYSIDNTPFVTRALRILGIVGLVGLVLGIIGGSNASSASSQNSLDSANTLRHVGIVLFVVLYVGVAVMTIFCWQNKDLILKYRRQLLTGVTATLPFLCVRVVYGALASFAPSPISFMDGHQVFVPPSNSGLGKFSSASSDWVLYLVMSVLMEYTAVVIYVVVGIVTPLSKDMPDYGKASAMSPRQSSSGVYAMGAYARPQGMR